jgi:transposase InsO family protein
LTVPASDSLSDARCERPHDLCLGNKLSQTHSGKMVRDMMVQCVEQRFGDLRAPHRVQWLTDNGSIFAANRTLEIAAALNLEPRALLHASGKPREQRHGRRLREVKRDYVRINPLPDARTALSRIDYWMEDYNCASEHPSGYVIEEKRLCWAGCDPAGYFGFRRTLSVTNLAASVVSAVRAKIQGPSGRR